MKQFDSRVYSIADFREWRDTGLLNLSPDFQRRSVWSEKAKSYLIDSVLRQKPIPKLIVSQELQDNRNLRVVVDGQQRLRAIFGFLDGDFKISRAHNKDLAGNTFDSLPKDLRDGFLKYELGVDLLFDPKYEEILDIFARINTYTVTLKKQEKLNAKYFGYFKQAAFRVGLRYVSFWLSARVLTKGKVDRMGEAELAGDLLMALLDGVQTNKNLEDVYKEYEEEEGDLPRSEERFDKTMSYIGEIYPAEELKGSSWRRPVLFYTLFTTIAHLMYGLDGPSSDVQFDLAKKHAGKLRIRLDEISADWEEVGTEFDKGPYPKDFLAFVRQSRRATTDTSSRVGRIDYLAKNLVAHLER